MSSFIDYIIGDGIEFFSKSTNNIFFLVFYIIFAFIQNKPRAKELK
jgi:hypothetical protein